ncbi:hypothetical protein R1flu_006974 [Riccia fluitans]|uniref:Uncharacterized protein n=1 Tax=Riccia fluitans TaxID=41844 RepID=A0ABD1YXI4_9MARC
MIDKGGKHYEACQGRNLGQLSIEEDPEGISGRLTRLTEVQLEVKLELNEQLSAIRRELRQATQAIQAEVKTLIQEEIKTLKNALLSGITGKETSVPLDIRLADMEKGVEVTPPEDTGNTTAVEVTPQKDTGDATAKEKRSLPSHLTKLSGLTLADAYFEYVSCVPMKFSRLLYSHLNDLQYAYLYEERIGATGPSPEFVLQFWLSQFEYWEMKFWQATLVSPELLLGTGLGLKNEEWNEINTVPRIGSEQQFSNLEEGGC